MGITQITEQRQANENIVKPVETSNKNSDIIRLKEFKPNFRVDHETNKKEFSDKISDLTKEISDVDRKGERLFAKILREERAKVDVNNKPSEVELCKLVSNKLGFRSDHVNNVCSNAA